MKRDIEAALPHRDPFLWITASSCLSRAPDAWPRSTSTLRNRVSPALPGDPILPGVFLVEAPHRPRGDAGRWRGQPEGRQEALGGISQFKFFKPVRPGVTFEVDARALVERDGVALVSASVTVDGEWSRLDRSPWCRDEPKGPSAGQRASGPARIGGPASARTPGPRAWRGGRLPRVTLGSCRSTACSRSWPLALASLFRLNRPLTFAATFINNPFCTVPGHRVAAARPSGNWRIPGIRFARGARGVRPRRAPAAAPRRERAALGGRRRNGSGGHLRVAGAPESHGHG